ncbi:MAG: GNAT family N-acetyltransferase [Gammaproteobacteria bacterium]
MEFRSGTQDDQEWLYQLFRQTMQEHIDAAWGWDELFQREGFATTLPASRFVILEQHGERLGCYYLSDKGKLLELDMMLVPPGQQRKGFGRRMIERIKERASMTQLPVQLSVLQSNPAVRFYLALEFVEHSRDEHSLKLVWLPR